MFFSNFLKDLILWLRQQLFSTKPYIATIQNEIGSALVKQPDPLTLSVELVPIPCWYSNLRTILPKNQWDRLRKEAYKKANQCCQICGQTSTKLECHEIWHYNDVTKTQILKGLSALCSQCHLAKHMGQANIQGKGYEAIYHLSNINKVPYKEAEKYVDECFTLWNFRNTFYWDIDLAWLGTQNLSIPNVSRKNEQLRLEPLRINFVIASEKYTRVGLHQPEKFWPHLVSSITGNAAAALECILPLHQDLKDPALAQQMVGGFVNKHFMVDDLFAQVNILLHNPFSDLIDDVDKKCLGLSYAHVLISLLPIKDHRSFYPIQEYCLMLAKKLCSKSYPYVSGQYFVQGELLSRWLTKKDVDIVWKQNAGIIPNFFFETKPSKQ